MTYEHALLFYQTITPLHVGCGQDVGVVDLPVIRERTTGYPFIPGSGVRGSVRDLFERASGQSATDLLFGPEAGGDEEERHAGCLALHDARLLLFPVRSDQQVFLWLTCPDVLRRFARDLEVFLPSATGWPEAPADGISGDEVVAPPSFSSPLFLEEFSFDVRGEQAGGTTLRASLTAWIEAVARLAGLPALPARTVLVADRTFHHFVSHATVVLQHNRLTAAKTVEGGALFAVEAVPPETVFYGFLGGTRSRREPGDGEERLTPHQVLDRLRALWRGGAPPVSRYLHLGGDEGTGLGVTRLTWAAGGEPVGATGDSGVSEEPEASGESSASEAPRAAGKAEPGVSGRTGASAESEVSRSAGASGVVASGGAPAGAGGGRGGVPPAPEAP